MWTPGLLRRSAGGCGRGARRYSWRALSGHGSVIEEASKDGELRVFMVAGEVSGDAMASRLMSALKQLSPFPVHFSGVGGDMMHKEGLKSIFPMEEIAVMGIWELLPHLSNMKEKLNQTAQAVIDKHPHVVVTVDSKGFSFRLLKILRLALGSGRPLCVHYVAPSFWAWKGGEARLKKLNNIVDHLLCILPFEEEVCHSNGLSATFVGHPVLEDALELNQENQQSWVVRGDGDGFRNKHGISPGATVITLLPGSRLQEVERMLPIYIEAVKLLRPSFSDFNIIIPIAPNRHVENFINQAIHKLDVPATLISGISQNLKYDAFSASQAALTTSGTATMELQLARLPCLVAYRAHIFTEWIIRFLTQLQYISLPNILLDSPAIPEALLSACTSDNLASMLRKVIGDQKVREKQIAAAETVFQMLSSSAADVSESALKELGVTINGNPSMISAYTILFSARKMAIPAIK